MKVSFTGIYDIRFPAGTPVNNIKDKYKETKDYVDKQYNQNLSIMDVRFMDYFNTQKTNKELTKEGIRISTTVDNPWTLCDVMAHIDKNLVQQYVDKAKVELVLDETV